MQYAVEKEIELITFAKSGRTGGHIRKDEIWLIAKPHKDTGKMMYSYVGIASNLIDAAAWKAGDGVMLGKVKGAGIYVFVQSKRPDAFILRQAPGGKAGRIGSQQLARELHAVTGADVFDAWVDDFNIYFKPKKGDD